MLWFREDHVNMQVLCRSLEGATVTVFVRALKAGRLFIDKLGELFFRETRQLCKVVSD